MSAGIYGPATAAQNKPVMLSALVDLPYPADSTALRWQRQVAIVPNGLPKLLAYMREGLTYISVITSAGSGLREEIRGQLEAPVCFETALKPGLSTPEPSDQYVSRTPYSFANVLVSKEQNDYAVLLQVQL